MVIGQSHLHRVLAAPQGWWWTPVRGYRTTVAHVAGVGSLAAWLTLLRFRQLPVVLRSRREVLAKLSR